MKSPEIPEGLKCEVTPKAAYGGKVPPIPEGWEFARFVFDGFAGHDEAVLCKDGTLSSISIPRQACIIVRRKPVMRRVAVEFLTDTDPVGIDLTFSSYLDPRVRQRACVLSVREVQTISRKRITEALDHLETLKRSERDKRGEPAADLLRYLGLEVED